MNINELCEFTRYTKRNDNYIIKMPMNAEVSLSDVWFPSSLLKSLFTSSSRSEKVVAVWEEDGYEVDFDEEPSGVQSD